MVETLKSGWLTSGSKVKRFEEDFANYVGAKHSIAVNSGTAALHLALDAIGIEEGDELWKKNQMKFIGLRKKLPIVMFVFSLMFWSFTYGIAVQRFRLFPFKIIRDAEVPAKEVFNLITGRPPRYYRYTDRTETVIVHRPSAFSEGLTLVSGLTKDGAIAVTVITRDGEVLHQWRIDWFDGFWPNPYHLSKAAIPRRRPATHVHGIALSPNGDLVFNLEQLGLVRMGLCGNVLWRLPYRTHHALHVDETGNIWVLGQKRMGSLTLPPNHRSPFVEHTVLVVTPEGKILREISIPDLLIKNGLTGLLYMSAKDNSSTEVSGDTLHSNDVEVFPSHLQPHVFERGDVMISLRNINSVMVFNPHTLRIKYLSVGKVVRQHDPDFVDGERISIFDNNNVAPESQGPQSRIVVMSARHDQVQVIYSGSGKQPFYTDIMGKHQWLPNKNILITESRKGRAFEIDAKGEMVWEYFNLVDKGLLAVIDEAQRLPSSFTRVFFADRGRRCGNTQSDGVSIGR